MAKSIRILLIAIFCITILISSYLIVRELQDNKNQRQTYKDLKQIIKPIEEDFKKDISPLFSENPDFIAWINIQGTKLDYPVMHTPKQPEKYLRLDFHQKYSRHGVPFLDGRCTLESDNLIIYGHNMKDGTMFAPMKKFLDQDFLKEHSIIELEMRKGMRYFEIFALLTIDAFHPWYDLMLDIHQKDYYGVVNSILNENKYKTEINVKEGDKLLTLSTCHGKDRDGRMVIIAKEVKK